MNSGYAVCGKGFNFTPEANAEYEVTFKTEKNFCLTQLQRLQRVDGKDLRTPIPIVKKDFPACAGRNAFFPKTYPDTPHRLELMNRVIDKSLVVTVKTDPAKWALPKATNAKPEKAETDLDVAMMLEYFRIGNGVTGEAVGHHLERMAQMDERYGVCARFAECWKRN
ncbi:hypothetical protein [Pseudomonas sp. SWRI92]|uniref:hypothetical protein n=1 Tax=Pseudomonas sp. SWRI92 TaxID=2745499 RepID=UPI001EE2547C|nr:hypothetical protein [Pseudomonas sp. SWRI92]